MDFWRRPAEIVRHLPLPARGVMTLARLLEICVDDPAGLDAAVAGGADRLEVCSALALGGLTPSPALVARAVATGVPVHVMIRPRVGDFAYTHDELAVMVEDLSYLSAMGVAGFVTGVADREGRLDADALSALRDAAPSCRAVVHRAIDLTPDPCAALETVGNAGYDFVLSSGGQADAMSGAVTLAAMVAAAVGRMTIIAGAGIDPANIGRLVRETGVTQVHASASVATAWHDPRVTSFGFAPGDRRTTAAGRVAALKAVLLSA